MADAKIFSVQPRFRLGTLPGSWALVDGIFRMGKDAPPYGSMVRDMYLSVAWMDEPMTAGVFSTWVERIQSMNWKVKGTKNNANFYAKMLHNAEMGGGWSKFMGMLALDYLSCDKGCFIELGRSDGAVEGKVQGIQQIDSSRIVLLGFPGGRTWRYYPNYGTPVDLIDDNLIQIMSLPNGRDRFRGLGHCVISRILDAKQLMLGYLTYYRQEIGQLPAELAIIINGIDPTTVEDSLRKYRIDKEKAGLDTYGKIWWLGNDDPANRATMDIHSLTVPNKSFNYQYMTEWWAKVLALNTGEDVGEYWLIQHSDATKGMQSVQAQKARGKGHAKFCLDIERMLNMDVFPIGTLFEFDNTDDEQDSARASIIATNVGTLKMMAETLAYEAASAPGESGGMPEGGGLFGLKSLKQGQPSTNGQPAEVSPDIANQLGADGQPTDQTMDQSQPMDQYGQDPYAQGDPNAQAAQQPAGASPMAMYSREELRHLAVEWGVIPPDMESEEAPTVIGAMLKEIAGPEDTYTVNDRLEVRRIKPLLKGKEARDALEAYRVFRDVFGAKQ